MRQLLHLLLTAVILLCPYVCCPVAVSAGKPTASCCHCASHANQHSPRDQQVPTTPSPCKAGDCLCRGAVLGQPVEMQLDLGLPRAVVSGSDFAVLSVTQSHTDRFDHACTAPSGPWSTGRELRLVIDSLLI